MDLPNSQKIAIVGIGCRYAGDINDVDSFWKALEEGKDCTIPLPRDRFDGSYFLTPGEKLPGKMYNLRGGYLKSDLYKFDRHFFKMSPEEANHMDPHIRLVLEVAWEALEDAGIPASSIRGSRTGVYVGAMTTHEYALLLAKPHHNIGPYSNSGNSSAMIANRISYEFDFRGPSFSLDSACSSSMYTIFLACEALKAGHCKMALAGGVNLLLLPFESMGLCQAGMVSPDGRSKSFDDSADGYGRGEGAGVLILKTLSKALADGDRIYAVLSGGALSNDGRTPGVTTPSLKAQKKLLLSACKNAEVAPEDIGYAETHGTGTSVGDKTELTALGESLGKKRRHFGKPRLPIGAIKSNLGHTEGAAGVAGVIKTALCLKKHMIPGVVRFTQLNSSIDFDQFNLNVPQQLTKWSKTERLSATCSSFGFGGANAIMVLEAYEDNHQTGESQQITQRPQTKPKVLLLSGSTKEALRQRLHDWEAYLQRGSQTKDFMFNAALFTSTHRSHHHQHRIGFVVNSMEDALEQIQLKLSNDDSNARCVEGEAITTYNPGSIVFVFSGMGTQWWGMARKLMNDDPIFARAIKKIGKLLLNYGTKWSLVEMLTTEENKEKINNTEIAQPCICAVQIGLVELWRERGIVPAAIVGHSVGEVAAAYCAGLLTLRNAIGLIYHRGRQLRKTSGSGTMLAVLHSVEDVVKRTGHSNGVKPSLDIAAVNSPNQVVLSGDIQSIDKIENELKRDGIRCVKLKVSNAFHSRQQSPLHKPFRQKVSSFLKQKNVNTVDKTKFVPMMSTVTSRYLTVEEANSPDYWWQNIRQQVSFKTAVEKLVADGFRVFVEIGGHPALKPAIVDTVNAIPDVQVVITSSLQRPKDTSKLENDTVDLLLNQISLHVSGVPISFLTCFEEDCRSVVSLPKYPWQKIPCSAVCEEARVDYQFPAQCHTLLGNPQVSFSNSESVSKIWRSKLTQSTVPWLKDHIIGDTIILPAAAYIETTVAAANEILPGQKTTTLQNIDLQRFMFVTNGEGNLETTAEEIAEEISPHYLRTTIRSYDIERSKWTQHGQIYIDKSSESPDSIPSKEALDTLSIRQHCNIQIPFENIYGIVKEVGIKLGPSFQVITDAYVDSNCTQIITYSTAPSCISEEYSRYFIHPAMLDGCFQAYALLMMSKLELEAERSGTLLRSIKKVPRKIGKFFLKGRTPKHITTHVTSHEEGFSTYCNITMADTSTDNIICSIDHLEFQTLMQDLENPTGPQIWKTNWRLLRLPKITKNVTAKYLIFPDKNGVSDEVASSVRKNGISATVVDYSESIQEVFTKHFTSSISLTTDILFLRSLDMPNSIATDEFISLEHFQQMQQDYPLFCVTLLQTVMKLPQKPWPRILLFTRGAHNVNHNDSVNPFMSSMHAILMACMYEEPKLNLVSVDIPHDANKEHSTSIICNAVSQLPEDENIVAYRSSEENAPDWSLLVPRVDFKSTAVVKCKTPENNWKMDAVETNEPRFSVTHSVDTPALVSSDSVVVDVQAFSCHSMRDDHAPNINDTITFFAGTTNTTTDDMAEEDGITHGENTKVIGFTKGLLCSTMAASSCNLTKIPSTMNCSDAVCLVTDFLPAYSFFRDIYPLSLSSRVLCPLGDDVNSTSYFPILANRMGADVHIAADNEIDYRPWNGLKMYDNIKIINIEKVGNSSFDLVLIPTPKNLNKRNVVMLLQKLTKGGTAAFILGNNQQPQNVMELIGGMSVKLVFLNCQLSHVTAGQTDLQFVRAFNDILGLFKEKVPMFDKSHIKSISNLPLRDGRLPLSCTVSASWEALELPLDLQTNMWNADESGSFLVTGGTSGFGLVLVQWLVARGAKHIFVVSRQSPGLKIREIFAAAYPAIITHIPADVSDVTRMEEVLVSIQNSKTSPPLIGIFHLAATFNDGLIYNLNEKSWQAVMATKAYGALVFHQLTQRLNISLKYYVVSSSLISMIGNQGQASYCAANSFLDSLCHLRACMGLPATSASIGFINSVGYAASNNLVRAGEERGVLSLSPDQILGVLSVAITTGMSHIGIGGGINKTRFVEKNNVMIRQHFQHEKGVFSIFKDLFTNEKHMVKTKDKSLHQTIRTCSSEEAYTTVFSELSKILSDQLGIEENITPDANLVSLGLDSLMASTVSQAILNSLEATVSAVDLINENTTSKVLCTKIVEQVRAKADDTIDNFGNDIKTTPDVLWFEQSHCMEPQILLVCFPSFGEGTSLFRSWFQYFSELSCQVLVAQLPGWEGRSGEEPCTNLEEIIERLTEALIPRLRNKRFILFGQNVGSVFAFEVAHALSTHGLRALHIFLSSWFPPTSTCPRMQAIAAIPNQTLGDLIAALKTGKGVCSEIMEKHGLDLPFFEDTLLNNRAMMLRLFPVLLSTLSMIKDYKCIHAKPLLCHMTVFAGKNDPFVPPQTMEEWKSQIGTGFRFKKVALQGKQMCVFANTDVVWKDIRQVIQRLTTKQ